MSTENGGWTRHDHVASQRSERRNRNWRVVAAATSVASLIFALQVTNEDNKGQPHALKNPGTPDTTQPSNFSRPETPGAIGNFYVTGNNWHLFKDKGWRYYEDYTIPAQDSLTSDELLLLEAQRILRETGAIAVMRGNPYDPKNKAPMTVNKFQKLSVEEPGQPQSDYGFYIQRHAPETHTGQDPTAEKY